MKNILNIFQYVLVSLFSLSVSCFVPCVAFSQDLSSVKIDRYECSYDGDGILHRLKISQIAEMLYSFEYVSAVGASSGDTNYICTISASFGSREYEWKMEKGTINVKFLKSAAKTDKVYIYQKDSSYTLIFNMSPANCGDSTPFAKTITINRNNKKCEAIEVNS